MYYCGRDEEYKKSPVMVTSIMWCVSGSDSLCRTAMHHDKRSDSEQLHLKNLHCGHCFPYSGIIFTRCTFSPAGEVVQYTWWLGSWLQRHLILPQETWSLWEWVGRSWSPGNGVFLLYWKYDILRLVWEQESQQVPLWHITDYRFQNT